MYSDKTENHKIPVQYGLFFNKNITKLYIYTMKHLKVISSFLLLVLMLSYACESDYNKENTDKILAANKEKLNATVDSFNTVLKEVQQKEDNLKKENSELQTALNQKPPETIKVVYKTRVKYKKDESVLRELEEQKQTVHEKDSEIVKYKTSLNEKTIQITEMQDKIVKLESRNRTLVGPFTKEEADSIIKSRLTVSDIEVELYTSKVKNKKKKYSYIEIIETSFTVNENKMCPRGDKEMLLCIYNADHEILHHEELETFKTMLTGRTLHYTTANQFYYDGEKLRLIVSWERKDVDIEPGTYTVEFYIDKLLAGIGVFNVE